MRLSARNVLKGRVTSITRGATTAHVKIDVNGMVVTASITNEAVDAARSYSLNSRRLPSPSETS